MYELQRCPTTLNPLSIVSDGYWRGGLMTTQEPGVWRNDSKDALTWKIARRASLRLLRVSKYRMTP